MVSRGRGRGRRRSRRHGQVGIRKTGALFQMGAMVCLVYHRFFNRFVIIIYHLRAFQRPGCDALQALRSPSFLGRHLCQGRRLTSSASGAAARPLARSLPPPSPPGAEQRCSRPPAARALQLPLGPARSMAMASATRGCSAGGHLLQEV